MSSYDPKILRKLQLVQLEILKDFITVCEKYDLPYFIAYGSAIGAVRHHGFIPWDDDTDVCMLRKDYNKFLKVVRKELGDKYKILTPEVDDRYACTVTHLQRKGTKFVAEFSKNLKCDLCIDLDIFPLDNVSDNKLKAKLQNVEAMFWGKLLFLCGTPEPVIRWKGVKKKIAQLICSCVHYVLKGLHVSPKKIYKCFKRAAIRYNKIDTTYITSFEGVSPLKRKIKKDDMFPFKDIVFEDIMVKVPNNIHDILFAQYGDYMKMPDENNRINHMPYIIQFENEEPIYTKDL